MDSKVNRGLPYVPELLCHSVMMKVLCSCHHHNIIIAEFDNVDANVQIKPVLLANALKPVAVHVTPLHWSTYITYMSYLMTS